MRCMAPLWALLTQHTILAIGSNWKYLAIVLPVSCNLIDTGEMQIMSRDIKVIKSPILYRNPHPLPSLPNYGNRWVENGVFIFLGAYSPISSWHVSSRCVFLFTSLAIYHSKCMVYGAWPHKGMPWTYRAKLVNSWELWAYYIWPFKGGGQPRRAPQYVSLDMVNPPHEMYIPTSFVLGTCFASNGRKSDWLCHFVCDGNGWEINLLRTCGLRGVCSSIRYQVVLCVVARAQSIRPFRSLGLMWTFA